MKSGQMTLSSSGTGVFATPTPSEVTIGVITYHLPLETRQSETTGSRYDENERDYLFEMLKRDVFGAYHQGCTLRKEDSCLTKVEVSERIGKDKTSISKLLKGPANWTLRTLSDLSNALDMDVKITLWDRKCDGRYLDRTGMHMIPKSFVTNTITSNDFNVSVTNAIANKCLYEPNRFQSNITNQDIAIRIANPVLTRG